MKIFGKMFICVDNLLMHVYAVVKLLNEPWISSRNVKSEYFAMRDMFTIKLLFIIAQTRESWKI